MLISLRDLTCLLLFKPSVCVLVHGKNLSGSCLPDSPSYWEPNQPPFPSPRTLRQTLGVQEGREGASLLREAPGSGHLPLAFPPGQVPTGALGLPGLRGDSPVV